MKTINFLESIANYAHYNAAFSQLLAQQSSAIKDALSTGDVDALKNQISGVTRFADECDVVQP